MAMQVHVAGTDWTTAQTVGTQTTITTTDKDGSNFDPKIVFFFTNTRSGTTDGVARQDNSIGFGVATGTAARRAAAAGSNDGQATMDTGRSHHAAAVAVGLANGDTLDGLLDIDVFGGGTNGFRYIVDDQLAVVNIRVVHVAIGGADVTNVGIGEFTEPAATGDFDVTGLGFNPTDGDLLLIFSAGVRADAPTTETADAVFTIGAASTSADEHVASFMDESGAADSDTYSYSRSGEIIALHAADGTIESLATFVSWITDGFRINFANVTAGTARRFFYAVIRGGNFKIAENTTHTAVETFAVSSFGFSPRGGLVVSAMQAESADTTAEAHAGMSLGAFRGPATPPAAPSTQMMRSFWETDAQATSRVYAGSQEDAVYILMDGTTTAAGIMSISSVDTDGLTFSQDDADPAGKHFWYIAMGDEAAASGSLIKTVNGLAIASVKTVNGLAIASVKTWDGLTNV